MRPNLPRVPQVEPLGPVSIGFTRLETSLRGVYQLNPAFVDAAGGAQSVYLPDGNTIEEGLFLFVKVDASVNTVTIYPLGAQRINTATSWVLNAQGESALVIFDRVSQNWWVI